MSIELPRSGHPQGVEQWCIWKHQDKEGQPVMAIICDELSGQRAGRTIEFYYQDYNDLN